MPLVKPELAYTSRNMKYTTIATGTLLTLALISTPLIAPATAHAAAGGETGSTYLGGTSTTGVGYAWCLREKAGVTKGGRTIWITTSRQMNSSTDTRIKESRYANSPNCPAGQVSKERGGNPIVAERVRAGFATDRWMLPVSNLTWRMYYNNGQLQGWTLSRANLGKPSKSQTKRFMVTGPHPEDTGNRLNTSNVGFKGPDRAFASAYGTVEPDEYKTINQDWLSWRKLRTKVDKNDDSLPVYTTEFPLETRNGAAVQDLQAPPSQDIVYKAVSGQLFNENGENQKQKTVFSH